jgi:N-acetyl-gamma-glutamyl-phosphate reductase
MSIRVGIVGVSGTAAARRCGLIAAHPTFELTYVAGEASAGQKLGERFPGLSGKLAELVIQKWEPAAVKVDVLFASLPTGESKEPLAQVSKSTKIVDIGGDHRYLEGLDVRPGRHLADEISGSRASRTPVASPPRR